MMRIRLSEDRGHSQYAWLDSRHSFSFANYYDSDHMGFSVLRVINEDDVAPGAGFSTHAHRDMEIISYVLQGSIEHKDSMGHVSVLKAGEVQRMTAGTGVTHSEYNPSITEPLKFLQIWIQPEKTGLTPGYENLLVENAAEISGLRLLASPDAREGSMQIHQDMKLFSGSLGSGEAIEYELSQNRKAYVHVVRGEVMINGKRLSSGDAISLAKEHNIHATTASTAEILIFDLP
ncbi:pirin family protein [Kaarinaea lacus]